MCPDPLRRKLPFISKKIKEPVNHYMKKIRQPPALTLMLFRPAASDGASGAPSNDYEATGILISSIHGRIAFDVYTTGNPAPSVVRALAARKERRYGPAARASGDSFFTPAFSSFGTPLESALEFFARIAHSGDSIPASEGRDSPRFDAEMASWATPTHEAFMVHAAAAAAARAIASTVRDYAKRRLTDHYMLKMTDNRIVIPKPDISAYTA